ncbi:YneF family protein [Priestia megaterium]|uniref:YneF family protein n=1 Tax=Priestia megaterium TaxID=1404 RepID=UPI002E223EF7|nr:YneF family protein [Priestia megaterium]
MDLILFGVGVLLISTVAGFFIGKHLMLKYIKENSTINEEMIRSMMLSSGQKPNQKKINQMMKALNSKSPQSTR